MNAEYFVMRKTRLAVSQHTQRRLRLERQIGDKARMLIAYGEVVKASVGTSPEILAKACNDCRRLAEDMSILAGQVELLNGQKQETA